ncbi:MAG: hypothetical protein ACUVT0_07490, partial [Thermochromatium sp.]
KRRGWWGCASGRSDAPLTYEEAGLEGLVDRRLMQVSHRRAPVDEWMPGQYWDLIVTRDDATNEHDAMFFVEEEGTASSFRGVKEVIEARRLFAALKYRPG